MIRKTHTVATLQEAEAIETSFLHAFNPMGYGSRVSITYNETSGEYQVSTSRFSSCD